MIGNSQSRPYHIRLDIGVIGRYSSDREHRNVMGDIPNHHFGKLYICLMPKTSATLAKHALVDLQHNWTHPRVSFVCENKLLYTHRLEQCNNWWVLRKHDVTIGIIRTIMNRAFVPNGIFRLLSLVGKMSALSNFVITGWKLLTLAELWDSAVTSCKHNKQQDSTRTVWFMLLRRLLRRVSVCTGIWFI